MTPERLDEIRAVLADTGNEKPWRVITTDLLAALDDAREQATRMNAAYMHTWGERNAERDKRAVADSILHAHLRIGHDSRHGEYFYCPQINDLTAEQRAYLEGLGE